MGIGALLLTAATAFQAFAGTAIGGFLVKTAIGVGVSVGLSAVSQKKAKQAGQSAPTGIQLEMATGADTPRSVAFGGAATRCHLAWFKETGANNDTLNMNIIYSDGWCAPPTEVIVDGVRKALVEQPVTGTEHARYHVEDFGSDIIVRWHDGRPGQLADSDMVAVSQGEITTDDVGEGLAYFSISIAIKQDGITSAPEFLWVGGGYRCYDLRQDSTVGGAGAHRLDDTSTWEPSDNPFVQLYNYAAGVRAGSDTHALGGFSDVDGLIPSLFMVAANVADESVITDGLSEPRYACAAIVAANGEDHRGKVAGFLQAGAGWAVERGGQLGVLAGAAQTPVVTFTDEDVIWDEEVEWSKGKERDERVNQVRGQFVSPDALYRPDDYPMITNASARAEDGEQLEATLDLQTVQSPTQAQRIADIRLEESRLGKAAVPLSEAFLALEGGDWARWNSARYGDYLYRIDAHQDTDTGVIRLGLQRTNNAMFGGPSFSNYTPPPTPALPPQAPSTVSGFQLQADVIEGEGGGIPVLVATWTPPNDPRVDAVIVQYREIGSLAWQALSQIEPEEGELPITGLASGADYEVRLSIRTTPSRNTSWTVPKSIKTANPPIVIPDGSITYAKQAADVQGLYAAFERVTEYLEEIQAADALRGSLEQLQRHTEDGEIRAVISNFGQETKALVLTETTARTSAIEALASQSLLVQAGLDGSTATALMALEAVANEGEASTSFNLFLRAETTDDFTEAGMSFEVSSTGSRVAIKADSFVLDDGVFPFAYTDGTLFIKQMRFERLLSASGSIDIDGNNDRIVVVPRP